MASYANSNNKRNPKSAASSKSRSSEVKKKVKCKHGKFYSVVRHSLTTGGCDDTLKAHGENRLLPMINESDQSYDYDLIVIGGGSGGLAASKVR